MNESEKLKYIKHLLDQEKALEARSEFARLAPQKSVEYFLVSGKIEQKFQHWGEAINAYNQALLLDPENTDAQNSLHFIRGILNFWNPDVFNP